ncbi:hypothetical protein BJF79_26645 [Actinomadura sp. CNU-125]|uniref:DUF1707 SHOCT-like domain-containing protein n=1 Tax=Actinomadura sp. CNU-125 TaxID=1904961 RepID=UPI00095CE194|nr:DUF1707 domain-containing protein [Actinomadura sp. CNU-125]OLT38601.1 hypothetical protein BJF79_26645 [Actinomadura sp. CNU-125]
MAPNPDIRASDADRDRVAESLREHCAVGRITVDELQERLEDVYAARTLGRLEEITADLPEEDLYQLPVPATQAKSTDVPAPRAGGGTSVERAAWAGLGAIGAINLAVWLIIGVTAGFVYPWWIWVVGPWAAVLVIRTVMGPRRG